MNSFLSLSLSLIRELEITSGLQQTNSFATLQGTGVVKLFCKTFSKLLMRDFRRSMNVHINALYSGGLN